MLSQRFVKLHRGSVVWSAWKSSSGNERVCEKYIVGQERPATRIARCGPLAANVHRRSLFHKVETEEELTIETPRNGESEWLNHGDTEDAEIACCFSSP